MKSISLLLFIFINTCAFAQQNDSKNQAEKIEMKQYWFVMLTKGPKRDQVTDTSIINKIQQGHMDNIGRLAKLGKIVIAGPFGDDANWRGIFIFDCKTKEETEELLKSDPAIAAGRLAYEIHPWWTAKNCVFK